MAKYVVPLNGWAGGTVTVETDETDPERIVELAFEKGIPGPCAQCGGWGQDWSLEVGDEWEPSRKEDGSPAIYEVEG